MLHLQGLGLLVKHKSRLELEKEKAKSGSHASNSIQPGYMRSTAAFRHATQANTGPLEESLVVHKSRLERERDAAIDAPRSRVKAKVVEKLDHTVMKLCQSLSQCRMLQQMQFFATVEWL